MFTQHLNDPKDVNLSRGKVTKGAHIGDVIIPPLSSHAHVFTESHGGKHSVFNPRELHLVITSSQIYLHCLRRF